MCFVLRAAATKTSLRQYQSQHRSQLPCRAQCAKLGQETASAQIGLCKTPCVPYGVHLVCIAELTSRQDSASAGPTRGRQDTMAPAVREHCCPMHLCDATTLSIVTASSNSVLYGEVHYCTPRAEWHYATSGGTRGHLLVAYMGERAFCSIVFAPSDAGGEAVARSLARSGRHAAQQGRRGVAICSDGRPARGVHTWQGPGSIFPGAPRADANLRLERCTT